MNLNGNYTLDDVKLEDEEITIGQWEMKYEPKKNHITKYPSGNKYESFETYGEEANFVAEQDHHYVWTEVQGDFATLLVPGMSYVNRLSYYVCELPWENQDEIVFVSMDIECHCYDEAEEDDEGDPDCPDCEGYGFRTVYPDDPEVKLYHEENA